MDMLSGSQIDSFLSATSLMWVSSIVLIMVGLVYYIKYKESHDSIKNSQFFNLYLLTIALNILEYIINIVMQNNPPYEIFVYKSYIFMRFLWNIFLMFYVINYLNTKNNKVTILRILKLTLIFIVLICTIVLNLDVALENNGKFYVLVGNLYTVYNIYAIISNTILLTIVLIFRKRMPKGFCTLAVTIFIIYVSILIFKTITGYIVNESVFIYSLLVLIIFNTTSNQDKEMVNKSNIKKESLASINNKRNKLINRINDYLGSSLNELVLYNDELVLNKEHAKELIQNESKRVENSINELEDYLTNVKDIFMLESNNVYNEQFDLNTLISNINTKILPLINLKNLKFNIIVGENTFLNYIGDVNKLEKIIINILTNAIENTKEGNILLTITSRQDDLNNNELSFMIKNNGTLNIDLAKLNLNSFIENDNRENLKIIIANELLATLNSRINIKIDDNNTIYSFSVLIGFKDNELYSTN